jgi:hypothetical protein
MKLKWARRGGVYLGRDHDGWTRAIVLKDATWICVAPLGMPKYPVKEICLLDSLIEARKAAQALVDRAATPAPLAGGAL